MKTILISLIISSFFIVSCKNNSKTAENSTTQTGKDQSLGACYQYANPDDTIMLKLIYIGDAITGTLVYILKEKDKNGGVISGRMKGDLMVANYTFMSEGVQSERQVVLKKQDNTFIEGYGDVETVDGKTVFKNLDSLKFNEDFKLVEVECK